MNILCVVAHPDDEVLGCGGTLAKHAEAGDDVKVCVLSPRNLHDQLNDAFVALGLGTGRPGAVLSTGDFADQHFDECPFVDLVGLIEGNEAGVVYTHHPGDLNLDHALTARAVLTAFRPKPGVKPCTILACEVLSSTEYTYPRVFQPNWYVSLTAEQVTQAQDALACYASEVHQYPHPRSRTAIRNRAAVRGSEIGADYAEAFQLLRGGPF